MLRQLQKRPTEAERGEMAVLYEKGATVYQLAKTYGCNRTTVASNLKRAGVKLRLQSPSAHDIDKMVHLYESGLSLLKIGEQSGFCPSTVQNALRKHGVRARDPLSGSQYSAPSIAQ